MSHQSPESDATNSDAEALFIDEGIGVPDSPEGFSWFAGPIGDVIDGEIVDEPSKPSRLKGDNKGALDREAKSGVPNIDEWMDFFSRILIRAATDFYVYHAFEGIDEDLLSDKEIDRIKLHERERDRIARPFAELCHKLKFTRKHGRTIMASAGTVDAAIQIGMWASRVNRVAYKYRQLTERGMVPPSRSSQQPQRTFIVPPTQNGDSNVSAGSDSSDRNGLNGDRGKRVRPTILGPVWNPDGG